MKSRPHDEAMAELYRSDPALAADLINSMMEDGDQAEVLIALRQLAMGLRLAVQPFEHTQGG